MITDQMVKNAARAMAGETGDDPDAKTYAREMACTGHDRGLQERWEFWAPMARAALTAALGDAGWQDISTAPKDGTGVNIYIPANRPERRVLSGYLADNGEWWIMPGSLVVGKPSHWRPLPTPPVSRHGGDTP